MQFEVLSDVGRKRTVNEDCTAVYSLSEGVHIAIIADGMGGHQGGDYASSTAVRLIGERFLELNPEQIKSDENWQEWLTETVFYVNRQLYEYAAENIEYKGMGTTLEVALIRGNSCLVVHIGDSRVYTVDSNGIHQVTKDHSYVNILLESGEITEQQAAVHPQRNWIMKALGSEKTIQPDFYSFDLELGSYLLLCTDGLSNKVDEQAIRDIVLSGSVVHGKAQELIDLANELGGEDNISVILFGPAEVGVDTP